MFGRSHGSRQPGEACCVWANAEAERLVDRPRDQLIGKSGWEFFHNMANRALIEAKFLEARARQHITDSGLCCGKVKRFGPRYRHRGCDPFRWLEVRLNRRLPMRLGANFGIQINDMRYKAKWNMQRND